MWVKLLGCLLVVVAGTCMGFAAAMCYSERPKQIRQLISCLTSLMGYINYITLPLPEALIRCTQGVDGGIARLFCRMAEILQNEGWLTPRQAISQALAEQQERLALATPEIDLLTVLGANLGLLKREEQQKYLLMVLDQLRGIEQEAVKQREQNVKMYRYLGVCGSLAVVILLV